MAERLFKYSALIELLLEVRSLVDTPNNEFIEISSRFDDALTVILND
ncbi:hypothetical protein [Paenibacillus radicis (ex Xue et al. 2023)]|uniref:Uncharacterized protein n=1 Tax=Paenibacillus radicis (ex Xue et al. 2023) TaxID=2972489 RepID=A0ABT1YL44_9BACL|nr:hypothetical protein [Paenibacillus radicis (ex Xue et al. 2023)]MCR8633911.1 hypothetical protein [Paenibacillus radicis (ex Xue et al. 2023)]